MSQSSSRSAPSPARQEAPEQRPAAILLYDGECPFCSRYADWLRVRRRFDLQLRDAREHREQLRELAARGYDINQGMILLVGDQIFHGAAAIVVLDGMASPQRAMDRLARWFVRVPGLVRLLYPVIKVVRRLTLWLMRREPDIHW